MGRGYIQKQAHEPQGPLQGLDRTSGRYWTEPLINTMTLGPPFLPSLPSSMLGASYFFSVLAGLFGLSSDTVFS
jgi:hypothetical protein